MLSWSSAWHMSILVTNPELARERLSWHIKNIDTSQSQLDCRGYLCHKGLLSTWHGNNHMMRLMKWWCIILTTKHGNTLRVCILFFSAELRNVCLGLCTDGFNPFGLFSSPYSCWLVILTIYNLPSGMCMRLKFMFLSTIIPGPSSPGQNIDVCLRSLIDELTQLWSFRALTYELWYIEEKNFCYEGGFDVDYQWFSSSWNGLWLEHAWKTSMSILHGKQ